MAPALTACDDLVGHTEDGVVAEADQDLLPRLLVESGTVLCLLDHRREIPAVDMLDAGPLHQSPGEEAVLVAVGRFLDAVGVEDDGAGELVEFLVLVLPGAAEVTGQVWVFFQPRIAVGRKHLAVGVDVDAGALCLLEQLFEESSGRVPKPEWPCRPWCRD